jgi:hypothetical protein
MRATQQTHITHSAAKPRFTLFGALHQFLVSPDETSEAFAMIQMIVGHHSSTQPCRPRGLLYAGGHIRFSAGRWRLQPLAGHPTPPVRC